MIKQNFAPMEFTCKCGCGLQNIDLRHLTIAEIVREFEGGKPYVPNSGCRCREHNETVQKSVNKKYIPYSSNSWHLPKNDRGHFDPKGICHAVDYPSRDPKALYNYLDSIFPSIYGMICYSWGVHIDTRPTKYRKSWI